MTTRQVIRRIERLGGYHVRTRGSHATFAASRADARGDVVVRAQVPVHGGHVPLGTLRSIQRQLEPAFGEGWLIR